MVDGGQVYNWYTSQGGMVVVEAGGARNVIRDLKSTYTKQLLSNRRGL